MKEKRIAVQLYGHLRTYKSTYKSLLTKVIEPNELNGYKIDIFIHTWDMLNESNSRCGYTNDDLIKVFDAEKKEEIENLYKPKKNIIESQKSVENRKIKHLLSEKEGEPAYVDSGRLYNMYYSMYKSNELREKYEQENNISYDFIIQTRPDISFQTDFNVDEIIEHSKKRKYIFKKLNNLNYCDSSFPLFLGFWADFPFVASVEPSSVWGNDLLLFSTPDVMNKVNSLVCILDDELNKEFWNHESFFVNWIYKNNVQIQLIPYIMKRDFDIELFKNKEDVKINYKKCLSYGFLNFLTLFKIQKLRKKLAKYL
jgi:hypothetical protein